jgi:peptidoglycan hydrolase CwlO-like protein
VELSYDELAIFYYELIARNADSTQRVEKQEDIIPQLQDERNENLAQISELNDEVTKLNSQLEHVKKQVGKMTTGTNVLDDILKVKEDPKSGGFSYKALNRKQ